MVETLRWGSLAVAAVGRNGQHLEIPFSGAMLRRGGATEAPGLAVHFSESLFISAHFVLFFPSFTFCLILKRRCWSGLVYVEGLSKSVQRALLVHTDGPGEGNAQNEARDE